MSCIASDIAVWHILGMFYSSCLGGGGVGAGNKLERQNVEKVLESILKFNIE